MVENIATVFVAGAPVFLVSLYWWHWRSVNAALEELESITKEQ